MALLFALGSFCFLIGPFPGYVDLVGPGADAATFFVGSIFFTAGGAMQTWLAFPDRHAAAPGGRGGGPRRPVRRHVVLQRDDLPGAGHAAVGPRLRPAVWWPDALGSLCFLVSGVIAYRASARHGWLPARGASGWWEPSVNLLGCVFFGIAAVAGYVIPDDRLDDQPGGVNWDTGGRSVLLDLRAGDAAHGRHHEVAAIRRLRAFEHEVVGEVERLG